MLKAARIGPLNAYEEGVRQLVVTYTEWAVVAQADVQMRSVEWNIVFDELNLAWRTRSGHGTKCWWRPPSVM